MRPELRMLGMLPNLKGTAIMERMLLGTTQTEDLSDDEINDVLYAWEARNHVPNKALKEEIDHVSSRFTEEDVENGYHTQEEYNRDYVKMIETYIKTIWA